MKLTTASRVSPESPDEQFRVQEIHDRLQWFELRASGSTATPAAGPIETNEGFLNPWICS